VQDSRYHCLQLWHFHIQGPGDFGPGRGGGVGLVFSARAMVPAGGEVMGEGSGIDVAAEVAGDGEWTLCLKGSLKRL
jgi:hypothetical protein